MVRLFVWEIEALLKVHGDESKAAAMAWKAFKGETARTREGRGGTKGEKAIVTMAVRGGTPEWIKPMNYGEIVLADGRCTCLVDRKALERHPGLYGFMGKDLVIGIRPDDFEDHRIAGEAAERIMEVNVDVTEVLGSETFVHYMVPVPPVVTPEIEELLADSGSDASTLGHETKFSSPGGPE